MIDWKKPIETVPCERNPQPVPCRVHLGAGVEICGRWYDKHGVDRCGDIAVTHPGDGWFSILNGRVRNVEADPLIEYAAAFKAAGWTSPDTLVEDREFLARVLDAMEYKGTAVRIRRGDLDSNIPDAMKIIRERGK